MYTMYNKTPTHINITAITYPCYSLVGLCPFKGIIKPPMYVRAYVRPSVCPKPFLSNRWTDFRNVDVNRCILCVGRCTSFRIFEIFIFGEIMAKKLRILAYFG